MTEPIAMPDSPDTPPPAGAIDAEIFSVGTWNEERFTRRDLHEIARNFRRLRGRLRPPLKFGHDEGQTLLGQHDGDPALGWVERLWVRGDKLLARFAGVPGVVLEAIRAGRYRRVSAELYLDVRVGGRRLGKALKAVALLGADLPAVTNLADLAVYLAGAREAVAAGAPPAHAAPADALAAALAGTAVRAFALPVHRGRIAAATTDPPTEEQTMPESRTEPHAAAQPPAQPHPHPHPQPELQAELAELRAYKERSEAHHAADRQRRSAEAFRTARGAAGEFCAAQVSAGRLPPHLHERLLAELDAQARHFAAGEPLRVSFDWVRRFIESTAPLLPTGEVAHAAPPPDALPGDENPSETLARLARNAMAELNLTYGEASAYVLRTHPALARAYRDFTVNPG
jgi:hypothetical protein